MIQAGLSSRCCSSRTIGLEVPGSGCQCSDGRRWESICRDVVPNDRWHLFWSLLYARLARFNLCVVELELRHTVQVLQFILCRSDVMHRLTEESAARQVDGGPRN